MSEGQTISPAELQELIDLVMDGDEPWKVRTRKLIWSYLLLCHEVKEFAVEVDRGMAEVMELARKLPGAQE